MTLLERACQAVGQGEPADVFLRRLFRKRPSLGGSERRLLANTVFSFFRWYGWLSQLGALGPETGAALAYLLDAEESHPIPERLLAGSLLSESYCSPLGGLSLVQKGEKLSQWLAGKAASFVSFQPLVELLLPAWVRKAIYCPPQTNPQEHFYRCVESFQQRPPTWLSAAPGLSEAVLEHLQKSGLEARRPHRLPGAIAVSGSRDLAPVRHRLRGYFIVQDLASQCVVEVCGAEPGQRWWDVCAGAGGKSIGLLRRLGKKGTLLATDRRAGILRQLERRVAEANLVGLSTGVMDGRRESPLGMHFDGVLVDAPCSSLGTWSRNPDARWRTRESEPIEKAKLQLELLSRAAAGVKPGGVLVYSVCTLTRVETVEVIEAFLQGNLSFSLERLPHPLWGKPTDGGIWIWPWQGPSDGMFIARMRRH